MIFGFRILLPALAAGALLAAPPAPAPLRAAGRPVASLYWDSSRTQPFLHPLLTASGLALSRGYPLEEIPGESRDHIWHHGLWWAHGDINGVDFWRDKGPETTGRIVAVRPPRLKADRASGRFHLVAPGGKVLGTVDQSFRVSALGSTRVIDVSVVVHADHGVPLRFGDTEEGTLGIRLREEFREDRGARITNAEGLSGTKQVWGKRSAWVDYTTTVAGSLVGVTLLDHSSNPKHPAYWHARNYGLCAANPFGEHDFLKDKSRDGSYTLARGAKLRFRYRVLLHEGALDPAATRLANESFQREK